MAEQNYTSQKPAISSETGTDEQRMESSGSRSRGAERRGKQQTKNLRRSARVPVTGSEIWNDATRRLRTLKQDTDDYVRKNPTKAIFTALGIGFVLALMRRR